MHVGGNIMYTHIPHRLLVYGSLDFLLHYMLYTGKCLPQSCWCFSNPKWYPCVIHHSHCRWRWFSPRWYLELVCHMHRRRAADHGPPAKTYHCLHWWTWVGLKDMTKMVNATHFRHPTDEHLCCRTWRYSGSSFEWTPLGSKKGVRNLSWPLTGM